MSWLKLAFYHHGFKDGVNGFDRFWYSQLPPSLFLLQPTWGFFVWFLPMWFRGDAVFFLYRQRQSMHSSSISSSSNLKWSNFSHPKKKTAAACLRFWGGIASSPNMNTKKKLLFWRDFHKTLIAIFSNGLILQTFRILNKALVFGRKTFQLVLDCLLFVFVFWDRLR